MEKCEKCEMVEGNCYLHVNVLCILVAVAQEHDLRQLIYHKLRNGITINRKFCTFNITKLELRFKPYHGGS